MTDEMFNGDPLATEVWRTKYSNNEEHYNQMHRRLAKEFAKIEKKYIIQERESLSPHKVYPLSSEGINNLLNKEGISEESLQDVLEDEIYLLFKDFKYLIPGGSIMANLGTDSITSLSNCFVIGQPEDSYGGILEKDEQLIQLMKRRGGVGLDISSLRPKGSNTTNAAKTSTGAVSFMSRYSNSTREVAQEGRRGALMISMDINHPDILDFIKAKRDRVSITGANISVKLNNEFMKAVEEDKSYTLRYPCDEGVLYEGFSNDTLHTDESGYYWKTISAKKYWNEIIESAHGYAEPGVLFWDNMINYSPDGVYPQYKPITCNPCAEIALQSYDSCRLMTINLLSFVENPFTDRAYFNYEKFYKVVYQGIILSDNLVDLEIISIGKILEKIENDSESNEVKIREINLWIKILREGLNSRRVGLGFTALADMFAAMEIDYGSDKSLNILETVMKTKIRAELDCTIDLAILRGPFKGYNAKREFVIEKDSCKVMAGRNSFYQMLLEEFPEQVERMCKYGRRNLSFSTVAPTGSVSILTQSSAGIEPLFQPYYIRRRKVNENGDYKDENGEQWKEYFIIHPQILNYLRITCGEDYIENIEEINKNDLNKIFEQSPWFNSIANKVDWKKRLEIQAVVQRYTTHSISSTINLPRDVTKETVSDIYFQAWKNGLKGVTVYRDGSRDGILITEKKGDFNCHAAFKRPKALDGEAFVVKIQDIIFNIFVGLYNNKPYEIFIKKDSIIKGKGSIIKVRKKEYVFQNEENKNIQLTENIPDEYKAITRLSSIALRHGAEIKYVVEQLLKCDGDIFSFTKSLARVLKKYIPDGTKISQKCEKCGSSDVVFEEGCSSCKNCGYSKCS